MNIIIIIIFINLSILERQLAEGIDNESETYNAGGGGGGGDGSSGHSEDDMGGGDGGVSIRSNFCYGNLYYLTDSFKK